MGWVKLLVGCPASHREWALPAWSTHVARAAAVASVEHEFIFVVDPNDILTLKAISRLQAPTTVVLREDGRPDDRRVWNHERYREMAKIRNALLRGVRSLQPAWFLSLDSDIFLHPEAIRNFIESAETYDVVGGRAYMTRTGTNCPSWGSFSAQGGIRRQDQPPGVFPVEIVMAVKLMLPKVFNAVEYEWHSHGEDCGFAKACQRLGFKLCADARVPNRHIMEPAMLHMVDPRCGW